MSSFSSVTSTLYRATAEGRTIPCSACASPVEPIAIEISPRGTLVCAPCNQLARAESPRMPRGALALALAAIALGAAPGAAVTAWGITRCSPLAPLFGLIGLAAAACGLFSLVLCARLERPGAAQRWGSGSMAARAHACAVGVATLALLWGGVAAVALTPVLAFIAMALAAIGVVVRATLLSGDRR